MAAGDPSASTVNADGRSATERILGVGAGGTYLYDAANSTLVAEATAKVVFTVVSKSFDGTGSATTISRTVKGTATQRTPGVVTLNETVAGSDLDIVHGLNEPIYAKDKTGAGNSGTNPTVAFLGSWYTKSGVPSNVGAPTVTNSSALAYYVPFGQWDILPAERVSGDFRVAFTARHLHGIACVKFTATGATSSHVETVNVTVETKRQHSTTGLYSTAHEATIPISGFTQGETINLRARAYPLVGDAELDTDNFTVGGGFYEVEGRGPISCVCDKTGALRTYAFVTVGAGGGTASTTLATAQADPFPTIKAALDANATQIYLNGTAHTFATRAVSKSSAYWITIEPAPGNGSTVSVTIASGFPSWLVTRLKLKNVTIKPADTTSLVSGGLTDCLCTEGCTFDSNSVTLGQHAWYNYLGIYHKDGAIDDAAKWKPSKTGGDTVRLSFDGCSIACSTAVALDACWRMVGCKPSGPIAFDMQTLTGTAVRNALYEFNKATAINQTWQVCNDATTRSGCSFTGNLLEGIDVSPSQLLSVAESANTDVDHMILAHNTIVGQRSNVAYNDTGSTAYFRRGWRMVGNIFKDFNTKHDLFNGGSGVDAARIGGWWVDYGTSTRGNAVITTSSFHGDYSGLRFIDSATVAFADDKSGTGGAGNGDYSLGTGSQAKNLLATGDRVVLFDFNGTAIPDDGTGAAGALQVIATGPPTVESATVETSGATLTLVFSEAVTGVGTGYTLSGGHVLSGADGTGDTWTFDVTGVVFSSETLTLSYSGTSTVDLSAEALVAFSDFAVVNNSTQVINVTPSPLILERGQAGQSVSITGSNTHFDSHTTVTISAGSVSSDVASLTIINLTVHAPDVTGDVTLTITQEGPDHVFSPTLTVEDTIAPTVLTATVGRTGATLSVHFSEPMAAGASSGAAWTLSGTSAVVGNGTITGEIGTFPLSPAAAKGETITISYTPGTVADTSTNALAGFSGAAVANSTGVISSNVCSVAEFGYGIGTNL